MIGGNDKSALWLSMNVQYIIMKDKNNSDLQKKMITMKKSAVVGYCRTLSEHDKEYSRHIRADGCQLIDWVLLI